MAVVEVVLVVADAAVGATLAQAIRADARAAALVVIVGDGSDDTLELANQRQPTVVVVTDELDAGDGAAFLGALADISASAGRARPWMVLVADRRDASGSSATADRVVALADVASGLVDAIVAGIEAERPEQFPTEDIDLNALPRDTLQMRAVVPPADDGVAVRDLTVVLPPVPVEPPNLGFDLGVGTGAGDAPPPPVAIGDDPPPSRDVASALRQKMSAMAARLFSGSDTPAPPDVGLPPVVDAAGDIDLGAFAEERRSATEIDDLGLDEPIGPAVGTTAARASRDADVPGGVDGDAQAIQPGERDAATLIARAVATSLTGSLEIASDGVVRCVVFEQGRVIFASSSSPVDRLGQLLVREGKVTSAQLRQALAVVGESGRRTGEVLVDLGHLKRRELAPMVRRHLEDIVYATFATTRGAFRWLAGAPATGERIRVSRAPASIIIEGVRRKFAVAELARLVGGASAVVAGERERLAELTAAADLSAAERALLDGLDGVHTVGELATRAGLELDAGLALAWSAVVLGAASVRGGRGTLAPTGAGDSGELLVADADLAIDRERVRARHQLVRAADYFALLGVRIDASPFEVRRAYETARRDFAPDAFAPELRRELAVQLDEIAQVLDEAYAVLRAEPLRSRYAAHVEAP